MARKVIPDKALQMLRSIGDLWPRGGGGLGEFAPPDGRLDAIIQDVCTGGLEELARGDHADAGLVDAAARLVPTDDVDAEKVMRARELFADHGREIASALLLAALPQAYAAGAGSQVLAATHQLQSNLHRRIPATAQFLTTIMSVAPDKDLAAGDWTVNAPPEDDRVPSWRLCAALRVYHAAIRQKLSTKDPFKENIEEEKPLNQEDLLGMLLSFSITVFDVLESYGIEWTTDDQEAYLYLWDLVGAHLGIGSPYVVARLEAQYAQDRPGVPSYEALSQAGLTDPELEAYRPIPSIANASWHGLRPPTIDDTRALLAQIQERQWPDPGLPPVRPKSAGRPQTKQVPPQTKQGRLLVKALLDELAKAMPVSRRLLPITVMRSLNPPIVRSRLSLGGAGAVLAALQVFPKRRVVTGPFTTTPVTGPITGRVLRRLGTEVASDATLMYLRKGKLHVPGLELPVSEPQS